jgi:hypothetical protein
MPSRSSSRWPDQQPRRPADCSQSSVQDLDRAGGLSKSAISPLAQAPSPRRLTGTMLMPSRSRRYWPMRIRCAGCGGQADHGPGPRGRQQPFDHLRVTPHPHNTNPWQSGRHSATRTTRPSPGSVTSPHRVSAGPRALMPDIQITMSPALYGPIAPGRTGPRPVRHRPLRRQRGSRLPARAVVEAGMNSRLNRMDWASVDS